MSRIPSGINYEEFNDNFFKGSLVEGENILWFNRKGIMELNNSKVAEIELVTNGVVGTYAGYRVRIIHKDNGEIARHTFYFNDYFSPLNRVDKRRDYDGPPEINHDNCLKKNKVDWYINVPDPDEIVMLANKILVFINLYM